jgi:hypothetical protein
VSGATTAAAPVRAGGSPCLVRYLEKARRERADAQQTPECRRVRHRRRNISSSTRGREPRCRGQRRAWRTISHRSLSYLKHDARARRAAPRNKRRRPRSLAARWLKPQRARLPLPGGSGAERRIARWGMAEELLRQLHEYRRLGDSGDAIGSSPRRSMRLAFGGLRTPSFGWGRSKAGASLDAPRPLDMCVQIWAQRRQRASRASRREDESADDSHRRAGIFDVDVIGFGARRSGAFTGLRLRCARRRREISVRRNRDLAWSRCRTRRLTPRILCAMRGKGWGSLGRRTGGRGAIGRRPRAGGVREPVRGAAARRVRPPRI